MEGEQEAQGEGGTASQSSRHLQVNFQSQVFTILQKDRRVRASLALGVGGRKFQRASATAEKALLDSWIFLNVIFWNVLLVSLMGEDGNNF